MTAPSLASQHRAPILTVDAMARVRFVGGYLIYDAVAKFPTIDAAYAALRSARMATERLDAICKLAAR